MKGKLTIFIGYAAGVGKTYAMLVQAHEDIAKGKDVVAGYLEMHDRADTLKLMEGIEKIPLLKIKENNLELNEFNLSLTLKRKPEIVLVDELAHTNPSSFKNSKRYQDVEELLNNGISVYTCVNIQHIESLNDIIYDQINVKVKEKVPDYIFDNADFIKVIDVNTEELIQRLNDGKIYHKEKINKALTSFFKKENLEILRKINLRKSLEKISNNEKKKECLVVCLSSSPSNERVIRNSKNIASALNADFYALYVDDGNEMYPSTIKKHQQIAEDIGAKNVTVYGDNIKKEIVEYVKKIKASKIVIGNSVSKKFNIFHQKSLIDELTIELNNCEIYVIPNRINFRKEKKKTYNPIPYKTYLFSFINLILTIGISFIFHDLLTFNDASILMIFILSLFINSLFNKSYLLGGIYALLYMLLFNFCFTEPRYSFYMLDTSYPLMLVCGFVISIIITSISKRLSDKTISAENSSKRLEMLLNFSKKMIEVDTYEESIDRFIYLVEESFNVHCNFFEVNDKSLKAFKNNKDEFNKNELVMIRVCYEKKIKTGKNSKNFPSANNSYYPLLDKEGNIYGVVVISYLDHQELTSFFENLLNTYLYDFASRIKYILMQKELKKSQIDLENEKFKSCLLRSISHDLKTPLTGINGNAQLLLSSNIQDEYKENVFDIYQESNWLKNMVDNILSISRFQEKKDVKKEINLIGEIIESTLMHVGQKIKEREVIYTQANDMLLLDCDSHLIEQAFINIINNALEHTKTGDKIIIDVKEDNHYIKVDIMNNGESILVEDYDKIFELFYSTKTNADFKRGSGLGLYITKNIIELHEGKIKVKQKGEYVDFSIRLKKKEGVNYV